MKLRTLRPAHQTTVIAAPSVGSERGSGTVLTLAVLMLAVIVIIGLMSIGEGIKVKHHIQNTADVAAIAGARAYQLGGPDIACSQAARVAQQNDVELESCTVIGSHVRVVALGSVRALPGVKLHASARAGPVNEPPS